MPPVQAVLKGLAYVCFVFMLFVVADVHFRWVVTTPSIKVDCARKAMPNGRRKKIPSGYADTYAHT